MVTSYNTSNTITLEQAADFNTPKKLRQPTDQSSSTMDNNNNNNSSSSSPRLRRQRRRRARVGGGSAGAAARCCCAVVTTVAAIAIAATQTITTTSGFISSSNIRTSPSSSSLLLRRTALVPVSRSTNTINASVSTTKQKQLSRLFAGSVTTSSNPSLSSSSSSSSETTDEERQQEQEECPVGSELLCMDRQEFEMQVGRAMDTLRSDYPDLLTHNPDYSIYDPMVELVDPSGVRLHGVKNYKNVYRLLHAIVNIFYCPERSGLTFRMCFDKARQNIRIHWNAQVIPREIFGGYKTTLHADGISIYEFDRRSGNITQHRLERLVINDAPVTPEQGIFAALRGHAIKSEVDGIPVFNFEAGTTTTSSGTNSASNNKNNNNNAPFDGVVQFQPFNKIINNNNNHRNMKNLLMMTTSSGSVLFGDSPDDENQQQQQQQQQQHQQQQSAPAANAEEDSNVVMYSSSDVGTATPPSTASSSSTINIDFEELDTKNAARKKFGLKPLTPEEFLQLQEQVAEIDEQQRKKKAANAAAAELAAEQERKKNQGNIFTNFLGNALQDTCETNFDCEWPEVCCDFGFKKSCCSSGMRILDGPPQSRQGQLAEVPIPQGNDEFPPNMDPRNPGGGGRYY